MIVSARKFDGFKSCESALSRGRMIFYLAMQRLGMILEVGKVEGLPDPALPADEVPGGKILGITAK
jgi:hypothetical protein